MFSLLQLTSHICTLGIIYTFLFWKSPLTFPLNAQAICQTVHASWAYNQKYLLSITISKSW